MNKKFIEDVLRETAVRSEEFFRTFVLGPPWADYESFVYEMK